MYPRKSLPPALGTAFTVAEARSAGVRAKRLRSGDLDAPYYGVRSNATASGSVWALCRAYATRMPRHQGFSHLTAVRLFGLPEPQRLRADARLHVTAIAPHHPPRLVGVRGYSLSIERAREPGTLTLLDGVRVISAVDTWCQLASHFTVDELIVLGDGLVRRTRPLATITALEGAATRYAGSRGARALAQALPLIRAGTDSPKETELRLAIVRSGLPEPEVNGTIYDERGLAIARGDLLYRRYKVLVEYDGAHHQRLEQQYYNDVDRRDRLAEAEWRTIQVNKSHRGPRLEATLLALRRALVARGWNPGAE